MQRRRKKQTTKIHKTETETESVFQPCFIYKNYFPCVHLFLPLPPSLSVSLCACFSWSCSIGISWYVCNFNVYKLVVRTKHIVVYIYIFQHDVCSIVGCSQLPMLHSLTVSHARPSHVEYVNRKSYL